MLHNTPSEVMLTICNEGVGFDTPLPVSTGHNLQHPDKEWLQVHILTMLQQVMSYHQISREGGLHWLRMLR